jgi:hypothetical protein
MCPSAYGRPHKVLPRFLAFLLGFNPLGFAVAQSVSFNIPAQEAATAIAEFARQAKLQIIAPADRLKGVRTHAIVGKLEIHAALEQLLNGTGLVVASDDGRTISLRFSGKTGKSDPAAPLSRTRGLRQVTLPVRASLRRVSSARSSWYRSAFEPANGLPWR